MDRPAWGSQGAIHSNFGASTGARRHTPGLPVFGQGTFLPTLDRVRQTSPASPNAVAPLTILDRVARPEPAVEACPAQLILISGAAGHSVPAALGAQSPPQRIALVSLEQRAGGYSAHGIDDPGVTRSYCSRLSVDSESSPMPARFEVKPMRSDIHTCEIGLACSSGQAKWPCGSPNTLPLRGASDLVPD